MTLDPHDDGRDMTLDTIRLGQGLGRSASARSLLTVLLLALLVMAAPLAAQTSPAGEPAKKAREPAKSFKPHAIFLPVVYYTPETRLALGAGGVLNYRLGLNKEKTRPSSLWILFVYTMNSQIQASLKPEIYLPGNAFVLNASLKYELFPQRFYGIGNDVSASRAEVYTPETKSLQLAIKRRIFGNVFGGLQYQFERTNIQKVEAGGLLSAGGIVGSQGGVISGLGFSINWDNRDNVLYPRRGSYLQFVANFYGQPVGSDFDYKAWWLDLRTYIPLGETNVLALQSFVRGMGGTPPFYELSGLGGAYMMRGIYSGMYRDKSLLALQAEYRIHVWRRLGVVGFMGLGDVGSGLGKIRLDELKYSFGGGLRYKVDKREGTNIRLDYAWGKGSTGLYITIQEAF